MFHKKQTILCKFFLQVCTALCIFVKKIANVKLQVHHHSNKERVHSKTAEYAVLSLWLPCIMD